MTRTARNAVKTGNPVDDRAILDVIADPTALLISQMREHAANESIQSAWKHLVAFTDVEIRDVIKGARSLTGALKKFAPVVENYAATAMNAKPVNPLVVELREFAKTASEDIWQHLPVYTDEEIAHRITGTKTLNGAVRKFTPVLRERVEQMTAALMGDKPKTSATKSTKSTKSEPKTAEDGAVSKVKRDRTGKIVETPVKLPAGFAIKYDNGAFKLAKRGEGAASDAPAWLVICTAHGTTTPAAKTKDADALGRKAARGAWCADCD